MDFFKSKQTLHRYPTDFLIGDLLVKAGVISQKQLDEAIKLSGAKHLQLGQMLVMANSINSAQLQAAVDAQSLVRDRTIDLNEALKVLKQACKSGQTIADVMASSQTKQADGPSNKLGDLLLEAGLITTDQFGKAMQRSLATGLPLGRILVLNNTLADAILSLALDLQVRIRDEMTNRVDAIDALRSAAGIEGDEAPDPARVAQAQAALRSPRKHGVRIGELFVRAGLLTETDVMNALETGLATDQLIGQVLVGQGFITDQILEAALGLQKMIDGNHLEVEKAIDTLSRIQTQGITYDEAVESLQITQASEPAETISFDHMLVLARVMTENEIHEAVAHAMEEARIVGQILLMTGHLEKNILKAALRAHFLLSKGVISQDDAVVGLDYCMHNQNKLSFDGALQELGWDISGLPHDDVDPETKAMEEARKDFGVTSDDEQQKYVEPSISGSDTADSEPVAREEVAEETVKEEESWELPSKESESSEETVSEESTKRSLSGLLSHEDLEPIENKEEDAPASKKASKFASLLSGDEPAAKKTAAKNEVKEESSSESEKSSEPAKAGGKFANLLGGAEPTAKKTEEDEAAKAQKIALERAGVEHLAEEIRAAEKAAAEKRAAEAEKAAAETAEAEKAAAEKAEAEKAAAEKAAAEKAEAEKAAAEKAAAEKAAAEKAAAEKAAAERAAAEKAAAEKAAAEKVSAAASAAGAAAPKVGSFKSLLENEQPAATSGAPVSTPATPATATPAQTPAPVAAQTPAVTTSSAAAPSVAAPNAVPGAPATPNVAAALSALTRQHKPGADAPAVPAAATVGAPAIAPGAVPRPQPAPGIQAVSGTQPAVPRPPQAIPAPVAAPGAPKISPNQVPGAARPAGVPAPSSAPLRPAAPPAGTNGGGTPPTATTPASASVSGAVPPAVPAPAAAPAVARTEDDVKGALSGAYARLAESYYDQGNYSEALNLYEKILSVRESELGESDAELVADLANLVRVLCVQNKFDQAESYVRRIIGILEMTQPDDVQKLADALNTLAQIYFQQNKFEQCQPVLDRSVKLKQQVLGEDHVDMADCYRDYARLMRKINRTEEAEQYYNKAKAILGKAPKQAVV